ncbi:hypothetical protein [Pyxidicoccus trucidator]|uniref:hypothetical protein n=1 Tax=Pyxidicoccus trucidator TaxID=2709662 RepID=UPI0013DB565A|nr:hypothetical protein [Pyxidicoccus trucidator]
MLTIRQAQFKALDELRASAFVHRLSRRLRDMFEAELQSMKDEALERLIRSGIERARTYGIEYTADIARYVEYMVFLGEDFDSNPVVGWVGDILRDGQLNGKEKMDRIDVAVRSIFTQR